MRVPVSWLSEYVDIAPGTTGEQIAASLVRVGLEEEGLHGSEITGPLVVGRVLKVTGEEQKNGKIINWCQVDVGPRLNAANGSADGVGIVCGAHNFAAGDLVVVILPGGELPGGFRVSARKTYGHVSAGMICSARELGLGDDHEGIIVLTNYLGAEATADLAPGQDAIPLLGLDDEVVEVNITPDRGYCFSMRGIAREYAHSTGAAFRDPAHLPVPTPNDRRYAVRLADDAPLGGREGCDRYVARIVRGLDVKAATPTWMRTRLTEAGMRPISLAVDVTNYVMLALGQPLHAFDVDTLSGEIVVRRARPGEKLTTLDDVARALDPEDLLITDGGEVPLAIAGVMGGETSEVGATTTDVLIESAHFEPKTVARSSRRHRLTTEASKRFERGVGPQVTDAAAQLAVDLLVRFGGGTVDEGVTDVDHTVAREPFAFDLQHPTRLIGVAYFDEEVVQTLQAIGCEVSERADGTAAVTPPSWRPDLRDGPDLVEEVARLHGYDQIPSVVPQAPGGRGLTHGQRVRRALASALAGQGLTEVLSYPFVGTHLHDDLGLEADDPRRRALRLANPLSEKAPLMRTSVLPTLLETLRRNVSRGARDAALFELGLATLPGEQPGTGPVPGVGERPDDATLQAIYAAVPAQPRKLALALTGELDRAGWWGPGRQADAADAIALARSLADALSLEVVAEADDYAPWHPGRCARLLVAHADGSRQLLGHAGEVHPKVLQALGLPPRTVGAELDVDVLVAVSDRAVQVTPVSTFPPANSDIALTVDRTVTVAEVDRGLRAGAGELLESVALFDIYEGDQVGTGQRSLAWRLTFRAPGRTLTTDEVNALRDAAIASAASATGAVQRGA